MRALSRRNDDYKTASRPYDQDRDGFVMGEGGAALIVESLESVQIEEPTSCVKLWELACLRTPIPYGTPSRW